MSTTLSPKEDLRTFLDGEAARGIYACTYDDPRMLEPVRITSGSAIRQSAAGELCRRYGKYGFAVFELAEETPTQASVVGLAETLGLGAPFVPPMYRHSDLGSLYDGTGVNLLSAAGSNTEQGSHPAFRATNGQELHSDGTLQPIGVVRTAILVCISPSAAGGESTLFNAVGAFCRVASVNLDAASALMSDCLRRTATVGPVGETHVGPAFTLRHGELLSRYSVTATDAWERPPGVDGTSLEAGCTYLEEFARPGSLLSAEFTLAARQGMIIANDKISHGRKAYRDAPGEPRRMLRGLFLQRPTIGCLAHDDDASSVDLIYRG